MKSHAFLRLLLSCSILMAAHAGAATLAVNWGGDYGTGNAFEPNGFTGGEPGQLSPSTNYSGTSSVFYGDARSFIGGIYQGTSTTFGMVVNNGGLDRIELKGSDAFTPDPPNNTGFLLLWKQQDFLNGMNTGEVGFDATSSVRLNITTYANQAADSGRLVLRSGGQYYISSRIYTASGDQTTANLPALSFFAYNPANDINVNGDGTPASIASGGVIPGVTEVGFYFESIGSSNAVRIQDFEVSLVTVPEPSSMAASASLLAAVCLIRRRRNA
ncbi:PEP-CTERM sorting domain-containing protein [Luteolibacter sp. SL250]|uniref:PEP-CTERM sorting domain-containing protein n=1 Tax=Luteolibacter sp. SL250 TaxID=2995170 RepID=UPI002271A9DF|nr:PEP-CTERM sorting domain-containing protein [Luteolibacter sp. SL250]WAC18822.1 PEP-CTERM sorting domain-containing protein [Luteolibacter sp. SL250]